MRRPSRAITALAALFVSAAAGGATSVRAQQAGADEATPAAGGGGQPTEGAATEAPAAAGLEDSGEQARKAEATVYYNEGLRLYDQGLFAAAVESFRQAQRLYQSPVNIFNIAKCYEKLGKAESCVEWFERYAESYRALHGVEPPDMADVRNSIAKCRLGMRADVTIESDPPGANVSLGEAANILGQTPYRTRLDPGVHKVFLALEGYAPFERTLDVRAGEPLKLVFKLEALRLVGHVTVVANISGASIFVDGKTVAITPYATPIELEAGKHQITVDKDEYVPVTQEVVVETDQAYEVMVDLWLREPPSTWKKPVGWTALVVGVLGAGAALTYGQLMAGPRAIQTAPFEDTEEYEQIELIYAVGLGVGAGVAAAGLALLIVEAVEGSTAHVVKDEDRLGGLVTPQVVPVLSVSSRGGLVGAEIRF